MKIKLLVEGGNMEPGPAIAQKIGPLGINMGKVIQEVNQSTESFKGLKVPVEVDVDPSTKEFEVAVFSPPVSELIKKEAGIEKGSGEQKKMSVANLGIEQIIKVAKTKHENMLDKNFKSAVKSVVGSCVSLGVLVESKGGKEIEEEIEEGNYDEEINSQKTEVEDKKKAKLKKEFSKITKEQQNIIEKEKEEEEAAEAAAEEAAEGEEETTEETEEAAEGEEEATEETEEA